MKLTICSKANGFHKIRTFSIVSSGRVEGDEEEEKHRNVRWEWHYQLTDSHSIEASLCYLHCKCQIPSILYLERKECFSRGLLTIKPFSWSNTFLGSAYHISLICKTCPRQNYKILVPCLHVLHTFHVHHVYYEFQLRWRNWAKMRFGHKFWMGGSYWLKINAFEMHLERSL